MVRQFGDTRATHCCDRAGQPEHDLMIGADVAPVCSLSERFTERPRSQRRKSNSKVAKIINSEVDHGYSSCSSRTTLSDEQ